MLQIFENAVRISNPAAVPPSSRPAKFFEDAATYARLVDDVNAAHVDLMRAESPTEKSEARAALESAIARRDAANPAGKSYRDAPRRGVVQSFSLASRRRLQRLLSCLRWSELGPAVFVTLTYHEVPVAWLENFRAFLQELRRREIKYLWRLEWQRRGAPHWHLILWPSDPAKISELADVRERWHAIAAHGSEKHLEYGWHQRPLDSFAAARAYLSKYVAKVDASPPPDFAIGRRCWGASRDLPQAAQLTAHLPPAKFFLLRRVARKLLRARARARLEVQAVSAFDTLDLHRRKNRDRVSFLGIRPDSLVGFGNGIVPGSVVDAWPQLVARFATRRIRCRSRIAELLPWSRRSTQMLLHGSGRSFLAPCAVPRLMLTVSLSGGTLLYRSILCVCPCRLPVAVRRSLFG